VDKRRKGHSLLRSHGHQPFELTVGHERHHTVAASGLGIQARAPKLLFRHIQGRLFHHGTIFPFISIKLDGCPSGQNDYLPININVLVLG